MTGKSSAVARDRALERASKEATDWLIFLQDDPDDQALRARFDAWLAQSPLHARAWEAISKTASLMADVAPDPQNDWQSFLEQERAHAGAAQTGADAGVVDARSRFGGKKRGVWQQLVLGGAAIAATVFAVITGPDILTGFRADYSTATGEVETVALADGSQVVLAPETAIRVVFEAGERHVELLNGEAYFEVTHNPERPFRVSANTVSVTVLGTGFDVSDDDDSTFVAVVHGLVRVDNPSASPAISELLKPGQSARLGRAGEVKRQSVPDGFIAAWRHNQLIAQDQPLGDVVEQLRRYYSGKIFITDQQLASLTVTGVYNLHDPVAALRGMARAQNAVVREITPWILLVSAS